jgi:hypothetical protein
METHATVVVNLLIVQTLGHASLASLTFTIILVQGRSLVKSYPCVSDFHDQKSRIMKSPQPMPGPSQLNLNCLWQIVGNIYSICFISHLKLSFSHHQWPHKASDLMIYSLQSYNSLVMAFSSPKLFQHVSDTN